MDWGKVILAASRIGFVVGALAGAMLGMWACFSIFSTF